MLELKQQTLSLINSLSIKEEARQGLLEELSQEGVTSRLLQKIETHIDNSADEFIAAAEKDIANFREELKTVQDELEKMKAEKKQQTKNTDADSIEQIRKQLK